MISMTGLPVGRLVAAALVLVFLIFTISSLSGYTQVPESISQLKESLPDLKSSLPKFAGGGESTEPLGEDGKPAKPLPISYRLDLPPSVGCETVVDSLQRQLITDYKALLKGVRYANVWGYLETENKGDAAIWAAQQMMLSQMGIEFGHACRFLDQCNLEAFDETLYSHKPNSAIIMAGGGNFNDFYWEDQPSRMKMVSKYRDIPIRAFPQSIHMTHDDRIKQTQKAFGKHPNLQLAARDRPSFAWLESAMSRGALEDYAVKSVLEPDIVFMWGNRPDFRVDTEKTHDILILARDDWEVSAGNSKSIPFGSGTLDIGGTIGNVTYLKVDWKFTHTPGIDAKLPDYLKGKVQYTSRSMIPPLENPLELSSLADKHDKRDFMSPPVKEFVANAETGRNQRAWAKAIAGFELLGSARFVITDRLHGHIMSTVIGQPHVLMDSKLGKNINFHDTWTKECECTRITENIDDALDVARLYFESEDS